MQIKHKDLDIPTGNPFENCQLNRREYANILTSIVQTYADGFVMAINNEWGTGKTTFVKMWQQQLINEGFKTLYFNAWENDFADDVLVALISELEELNKKGHEKEYKAVLEKAAPYVKKIIPGLTKAAAKLVGLDEFVQAIINGTIEVGVDEMAKAVEAYSKRKKGVKEFRESLEKYVKASTPEKPVVFIIDELDRCRPNYAVEVLEQIKHLFSVPGIVFVLSIDKEELGNAIRGAYGSEKIKANEYLRRFIDLEYSIPEPDLNDFCKYMINFFKFDEFLFSGERIQYSSFKNDKSSLIDFSIILFKQSKANLRQIEKIYAHMRLTLNTCSPNAYIFPNCLLLLVFLFQINRDLINKIMAKSLTLQEFTDLIENMFPATLNDQARRIIVYTLSVLIWFYFNYYKEGKGEVGSLISENNGAKELAITSGIDISIDNQSICNILDSFKNNRQYDDTKITYLLDKIFLTQSFQI